MAERDSQLGRTRRPWVHTSALGGHGAKVTQRPPGQRCPLFYHFISWISKGPQPAGCRWAPGQNLAGCPPHAFLYLAGVERGLASTRDRYGLP